MAFISGQGAGSGKISGVTVSGTAASGQVPVASSASAGTWSYPPGFEISYTQITSIVNIVSTTESSGTTIISPGAVTFDGGAVAVEFFAIRILYDTVTAADAVVVSLFEGATQITRLAEVQTQNITTANSLPGIGKYRFTPSAGSHTYTVTAFAVSTTGGPAVVAGSGGTGGFPPAYIRFTKV